MKTVSVIVVALFAGFLGGILGGRLSRGAEQARPQPVVRARSFELVDQAGKAISIWGVNRQGHTLLAFLGPDSGPDQNGEHATGLDNLLNQRAAFGIMGMPSLAFKGADGHDRMALLLSSSEKPTLWMGDENGRRVVLGHQGGDTPTPDEDDDWFLSFEPDRASMGMYSRPDVGGQKYVRGVLSVNKDSVKFP